MIGLICLYYIIGSFNWEQIWLALKKVNPGAFLAVESFTLFACFILRTLRWHLLLKGEKIDIPFGKLYLYNAFAIGFSTVTPFQSGEALKVELIRKYGGRRLSGYAIFFLERIFDLLTVVGLAIVSTAFGLDFGVKPVYLYIVGGLLLCGAAAAVAAVLVLPFEAFQPLKVWIHEHRQKKTELVLALILTVLSWSSIILGWQLALRFFGISIGFLQSVALVTLTTLITIISFVPGAVGVSELSVATILSGMGVETVRAQTGAIAIRSYALVIIILTLIHWIYLKFIYKNNSKSQMNI